MSPKSIADNSTDHVIALHRMLSPTDLITIGMVGPYRAAQLLAWLHLWGGGCEAVVVDKTFHTYLLAAQQLAGFEGEGKPNPEIVAIINEMVREVKSDTTIPEWAQWVFDRFNIKVQPL